MASKELKTLVWCYYNKVEINLTTYNVDGIIENDLKLA
jgi:pterin-4a-carbinolamine dehydratase